MGKKTTKIEFKTDPILENFGQFLDVIFHLFHADIPFIIHHGKHAEGVKIFLSKHNYKEAQKLYPDIFKLNKVPDSGTTTQIKITEPRGGGEPWKPPVVKLRKMADVF